MSKPEMLMEYITQDIVAWLMDDEHLTMEEALRRFYSSEIFGKLNDPDTGLYLDASISVYRLFQEEQINGQIVQNEI